MRFQHLACILRANTTVTCVIAGDAEFPTSYVKNPHVSHNLGSGLAKKQWGLKGKIPEGKNYFVFDDNYNKDPIWNNYLLCINLIDQMCVKLFENFGKRISYGQVGIVNGMSNTNIHVWGANIDNFLTSNFGGAGQADAVAKKGMGKTTNSPGAFGIITTPLNCSYEDLEKANKNYISKFFSGLEEEAKGGSSNKRKTKKNVKRLR